MRGIRKGIGTERINRILYDLLERAVHGRCLFLRNGKLITNVQNSLLSKIGTASDVLNHIPGVQGKDGAYSVFGKGTPSIYLNGRLVRDLSELERLGSENIARVEVLNNPGVQYDASVKRR